MRRSPVWIGAASFVFALIVSCAGVTRAAEEPATAPAPTPPATAPAKPAKDKGMISGIVKNADDTIAVDLKLRLVQDDPISMGGGGGRGGEKLIQNFTTDKDGNYTFNNLKPGSYRIIGGNNQIGWIYYDLDVPANEITKLDLKLTKLSGGGGGDK